MADRHVLFSLSVGPDTPLPFLPTWPVTWIKCVEVAPTGLFFSRGGTPSPFYVQGQGEGRLLLFPPSSFFFLFQREKIEVLSPPFFPQSGFKSGKSTTGCVRGCRSSFPPFFFRTARRGSSPPLSPADKGGMVALPSFFPFALPAGEADGELLAGLFFPPLPGCRTRSPLLPPLPRPREADLSTPVSASFSFPFSPSLKTKRSHRGISFPFSHQSWYASFKEEEADRDALFFFFSLAIRSFPPPPPPPSVVLCEGQERGNQTRRGDPLFPPFPFFFSLNQVKDLIRPPLSFPLLSFFLPLPHERIQEPPPPSSFFFFLPPREVASVFFFFFFPSWLLSPP